jgi:hypothetical protein
MAGSPIMIVSAPRMSQVREARATLLRYFMGRVDTTPPNTRTATATPNWPAWLGTGLVLAVSKPVGRERERSGTQPGNGSVQGPSGNDSRREGIPQLQRAIIIHLTHGNHLIHGLQRLLGEGHRVSMQARRSAHRSNTYDGALAAEEGHHDEPAAEEGRVAPQLARQGAARLRRARGVVSVSCQGSTWVRVFGRRTRSRSKVRPR